MTNVLDAYPFDAGPGANSGQTRWQKMAKVWAGNGVVPQSVSGLGGELSAVYNSSSNNITVSPGAVNINGTYGELAAQTTVNATGDGLLVARLDNTGDQILVAFNLGAAGPVQTTTTWEIALARLASGTLTDQRAFCGPRGALPAPPTGAGVHTYTDPFGAVWVSLSGGAWKQARDVCQARGYRAAAGNTANNAVVAFDTVTPGFDPLGMLNTATGRFTIPVAGRYFTHALCTANAPVANAQMSIQLRRNATQAANGATSFQPNSGWAFSAETTNLVSCSVGDILDVIWQGIGTASAIQTGSGITFMFLQLLSLP